MFQIDLTSEGKLNLILPGARSIEIPATVGGLNYIKNVIRDHHNNVRNQRGYIGTLPTQHAVDKSFADQFLAEKRRKAAEEMKDSTKAKANKLDIDWDRLEINL
jgi:phosphoenolpyruvate-protein kinase (PTS system EI component)